jgi:hypothetical protein
MPLISGVAPADVIEACKRHDDPAHAIGELCGLVELADRVRL